MPSARKTRARKTKKRRGKAPLTARGRSTPGWVRLPPPLPPVREGTRKSPREPKQRKFPNMVNGDKLDTQTYSIESMIQSPKFADSNYSYPVKFEAGQVKLEYFQKHGFEYPVLVNRGGKAALGMKVPPSTFTVDKVAENVGRNRTLEVMTADQDIKRMLMGELSAAFDNNNLGDFTLNLLSLEVSFTKLGVMVLAPKVVRQLDLNGLAWPVHLRKQQEVGTNDLKHMKFPKVQKYCLISMAKSYTDTHQDFAGTSVWYHVLWGEKVFWLIPPTDENIKKFVQYKKSNGDVLSFFGDQADGCVRVVVRPGNTLFIPSGWLHAVYTPVKSLVFGGNFLHSFSFENQIKVWQTEKELGVEEKFSYPFFIEHLWYVLARYVLRVLGRNHLLVDDNGEEVVRPRRVPKRMKTDEPKVYFPTKVITGLKAVVEFLGALPEESNKVPALVVSADELLEDARRLLSEHKRDKQNKVDWANPILEWQDCSTTE